MTIQPLSVSAITQAVERVLLRDLTMEGVTVERSTEVNSTPAYCPWVGVYRAESQFPARTLGVSTGYRTQRTQVLLILQETDASSGAACEDRLNELVSKVVAVLLSDTTLGGVVNTLEEFTVRYPDYRRVDDDSYLQTAMLFFTAINPVVIGG